MVVEEAMRREAGVSARRYELGSWCLEVECGNAVYVHCAGSSVVDVRRAYPHACCVCTLCRQQCCRRGQPAWLLTGRLVFSFVPPLHTHRHTYTRSLHIQVEREREREREKAGRRIKLLACGCPRVDCWRCSSSSFWAENKQTGSATACATKQSIL